MGASHFSGLACGSGGTELTLVKKGTVSIDPASIAAGAVGETSVTIAGAAAGDSVIMNPPAAGLTAGLIFGGCTVSAANTVKVRIFNSTAGAIDEAAGTWTYAILRS